MSGKVEAYLLSFSLLKTSFRKSAAIGMFLLYAGTAHQSTKDRTIGLLFGKFGLSPVKGWMSIFFQIALSSAGAAQPECHRQVLLFFSSIAEPLTVGAPT